MNGSWGIHFCVEFSPCLGQVTAHWLYYNKVLSKKLYKLLKTPLRDKLDITIIMPLLMFHYSAPVINLDSENSKGFFFFFFLLLGTS